MRYIPVLKNMFLFHSLDAHGQKRDSKRLFYFTYGELLENSTPAATVSQDKLDQWQRESDRLN